MATYVGTVFNDYYTGGAANQYGLDGNDTLSPKNDNKAYRLYGGNGSDSLDAYNSADEIYGGAGSDFLRGYGGDDYLEGGSGADKLRGDNGNDILNGGKGADIFVFSSQLNANKNFDSVVDFKVDQDIFYLDNNVFSGIGGSKTYLAPEKFVVGTNATSSTQRIIYNPDNGVLFYDPDGSGPQAKVKFAGLNDKLDLTSHDFWVF